MVLFQIMKQEIGNDCIIGTDLQFAHFHMHHLIILFLRRLNQTQCLFQISIKELSFRRRIHPFGCTHQQRTAHTIFQLADRHADCGLRNI